MNDIFHLFAISRHPPPSLAAPGKCHITYFFFFTTSINTAAISTRPVNICCQFACSPINGRPTFIRQITMTPKNAPIIEPTPPDADTPPTMAPPMASNSNPAPEPG